MRIVNLRAIALFVALLALVGSAVGQHSFNRTITVDPSGRADFTTIQGAINSITNPSSGKYTILIFSETYAENITLDDEDENIDLVGIDREAVIIAPSTGAGIVITSGTETSRNNRIANLTIITSDGHGIEIVKGGTPAPKDITIEGVTIHADGTGKIGVTGVLAENVTLTNCIVTSDDSDGMHVGNRWTLSQITVETIEEVGEGSAFNQDALVVGGHTFLTVTDSTFIGERRCIWLDDAEDILVQNSQLTTSGAGGALVATLMITGVTKRVLFQNCLIVSDATLTAQARSTPRAVFVDDAFAGQTVEDIVLQSCRIIAVGDGSGSGSITVAAVTNDIEGTPTLVDCELSAINKKTTTPAEAYGVWKQLRVLGGAISSSSAAQKETEVWDVASADGALEISGTRLSKWKGPINSAERPRAVIQRTINIDASTSTAIHDAIALIAMDEQPITADITNPDVYRVLRVLGNETDMDQDVYIIGTDWADNVITEKIKLTGNTPAKGVKPFKTVTKIIVPAWKDPGETVSIGTTSKIGLYFPIASTSDVLQQGLKASSANSYTLEAVSTPDATYGTIDLGLGLTDNDSYEWAILAIQ